MPAGRPAGTRKRSAAETAAWALLRGDVDEIRAAALAHFHLHAGGEPRSAIGDNERERFRNFVEYVEQAFRELLETNNAGSLRKRYGPFTPRTINRQRQLASKRKLLAEIRADLGLEQN